MKEIFVFGSNLAGRHGKGAALHAMQHHGAVYGVGVGPMGTCYAIPTKDQFLQRLTIPRIKHYVEQFLIRARQHPDFTYRLTPIGCGLAGYKHEQIAPLFRDAPPNVLIPPEFQPFIAR